MARSKWKTTFIHPTFTLQQKNNKVNSEIFLVNRATQITKQMVGNKVQVYNGIRFFPFSINNDMVGQRVGEFSPTRKRHISPKKKTQQK